MISALIQGSKPRLATFVKYAKVELTPPTPGDIPKIAAGIKDILRATKNYKDLTVKDACVNSLIAIEVLCWFYVGECIGKRNLVGYNV